MKLKDKVAVVTGASRGIGRAIALAVSKEGSHVCLVARTKSALEETRDLIIEAGGKATVIQTDLTKDNEIENLVASIIDHVGTPDILVNVAGVWHNNEIIYQGPHLENTPVQQIHEVIDVGLKAPFLLSRLVLPSMIRNLSGKILQISGAFEGETEAVGWLHYYVTKKALEAFTRGLAEEVRQFEIQVNCISPWFVATGPALRLYPKKVMRNALTPEDVARYAVFLLSDEAQHITGSITVLRNKCDH